MANAEINDLTAKTTPVGSDEIEIQETAGGASKKVTLSNLQDNYLANTFSQTAEEDIPINSLSSTLAERPNNSDLFAVYDADAAAVKKVAGTWMALTGTDSDVSGGTSTNTAITPSRLQLHTHAAKAWAYITLSGSTPTLVAEAGVASAVDLTGAGRTGVNLDDTLNSADVGVLANIAGNQGSPTTAYIAAADTQSTSQVDVYTYDGGTATDGLDFFVVVFGRT